MVTLREKVKTGHLSLEEMMDIALSVCIKIDAGEYREYIHPDSICLKPDNAVIIQETSNMVFEPPEVLRSQKMHDQNACWFSLGLLIDYMVHGKDYYVRQNQGVLEILEKGRSDKANASTVPASQFQDRKLGEVVEKLTQLEPKNRQEGVGAFLQYLSGIKGTFVLEFVCGDAVVYRQSQTMQGDEMTPFRSGDVVVGLDGGTYKVQRDVVIPYRPGEHKYRYEVTAAGAKKDGKRAAKKAQTGQQAGALYLMMRGKPRLLFEADSEMLERAIPIACESDTEYCFMSGAADGNQQNLNDAFRVTVRGNGAHPEMILKIRYAAADRKVLVSACESNADQWVIENWEFPLELI